MYLLLGYKKLVTTLLYRGSEHGWKYIDFHSRCDGKGPTISLFKIKEGDCVGGFTKAQWTSTGKCFNDTDAMVFNLSCCRHYPSKKSGNDIKCCNNYGPTFGSSNDLSALSEPF